MLIALFTAGYMSSCKPGAEGKSSKVRKQDSVVLISSNVDGNGKLIEFEMKKGKAHNHPSFVVWLEDSEGKYIQTLFITRAIGQGVFNYGDKSGSAWKPGEVSRPAALPYWTFKRGVRNEDGTLVPTPRNKVPDAYSGATPNGSFRLTSKSDTQLTGNVKVMMEINQPWDWNEYWTNTMFDDDADYKTSCQPAIVYSAVLDMDSPGITVEMIPIGHSHYSGKSGELFPDLSTITTALHIAEKVTVTVK